VRLQACEGSFLVGADQPAVAGDVRSKDGGQPAFDAFPNQSGTPNRSAGMDSRLRILTAIVTAGTVYRSGCRLQAIFG